MAKRPTKIEKLRRQLAEVQRQLEEAELAVKEERRERINQAMDRAGVLALDIPPEEIIGVIEAALREFMARRPAGVDEEGGEPTEEPAL